jgi:hypothetical protein
MDRDIRNELDQLNREIRKELAHHSGVMAGLSRVGQRLQTANTELGVKVDQLGKRHDDDMTAVRAAVDQVGQQAKATAERHAGLAKTVDGIAKMVLNKGDGKEDDPDAPPKPVQWLSLAAKDATLAELVLEDLCDWLGRVYMEYPGGRDLPQCWMCHPWVIQTLLDLRHAHHEAYSPGVKAVARLEWQDKHRSNVVDELRDLHGRCSVDKHANPLPPPVVPMADSALLRAKTWARHRAIPFPTGEELASAEAADEQRRTLAQDFDHAAV